MHACMNVHLHCLFTRKVINLPSPVVCAGSDECVVENYRTWRRVGVSFEMRVLCSHEIKISQQNKTEHNENRVLSIHSAGVYKFGEKLQNKEKAES